MPSHSGVFTHQPANTRLQTMTGADFLQSNNWHLQPPTAEDLHLLTMLYMQSKVLSLCTPCSEDCWFLTSSLSKASPSVLVQADPIMLQKCLHAGHVEEDAGY